MKRKIASALAAVMAVGMLGGCKKEESQTSVAQPLPVSVETGTIAYYTEPEPETPLVPELKKKVKGMDYARCTLNTEVFDFKTAAVSDLVKTVTGEIDGKDVKEISNDDFRFHGFMLSGKMYVELTQNNKPVTEYNKNDLDDYEFKAMYTSSKLLGERGNYLTFGARTFIGLTKEEVETTFGKGYISGYDKSTFYYPDENGYILALSYKDNVLDELYLFKPDPEEEEEK